MKHIFYYTLCLALAAPVFAAPTQKETTVTEIRLVDNPGFVRAPRPLSEFTFRSDDTLEWLGGNDKAFSHLIVSLPKGEFQKLVDSLENQKFFDLDAVYPTGLMIADAPSFTVSVTKDGQKKQVEYTPTTLPNAEPLGLWMTEKMLRGVAWEAIQKQAPTTPQ